MKKTLSLGSLIFLLFAAASGCDYVDELGPPIGNEPPAPPRPTAPAPPAAPKVDTEVVGDDLDPREQYIGRWLFTSHQHAWSVVTGQAALSDTVTFVGEVTALPHTQNELLVRYRGGENVGLCGGIPVWGAYLYVAVDGSGHISHPYLAQCSAAGAFLGDFSSPDIVDIDLTVGNVVFTSGHTIHGERY